ncbi:MAG: hypothetical protein EAZ55_05810 [Cytophagales bacterium]|nr:MAG: hypothetical protein EAZ55_05810 [Cytophagales bacterium]
MKKIFIGLMCFLSSQTLKAQFVPLQEVNILPAETFYTDPEFINAHEKGIIYYRQEERSQQSFNFYCLDTNFVQVWTQKMIIPPRFFERAKYYDENQYFYLLAQSTSETSLNVLKVDIETGNYTNILGDLPFRIEVVDFKVIDDEIFVVGVYKEYFSVLLKFRDKEKAVLIPVANNKNLKIQNIHADLVNKQLLVDIYDRRNCRLLIAAYSTLLGMVKNYNLNEKSDRKLKNVNYQVLPSGNRLMVGTQVFRCTTNTQGLITQIFSNNEPKGEPSYYKFIDFTNFLKQYRPPKEERIRGRIVKKQVKSKDLILTNDMVMHKNFYTMPSYSLSTLENYTEEYRQMGSTGLQGRDYRVFDGYQYRYATVCAFDAQGKKIWDNLIKIEKLKLQQVQEVVKVGNLGDSIVLAYERDDKICSKMIYRYQTVRAENEQIISDLLEDKTISQYAEKKLWHLYDNYFIIEGYTTDAGREHPTFYLRKIMYVPFPEEDETQNERNNKQK